MRKVAVFAVIYPGNLPYFNEFLTSLVDQQEKSFDLVLMSDGVGDIEKWLSLYRDRLAIYVHTVATGTIASVRAEGFAILSRMNYDKIIFADTDDILAPDRVKCSVEALEHHRVVINDLAPFETTPDLSAEGYWDKRLDNGHIFNARDIERFNFVGLGNASIRKDVMVQMNLPMLRALDWFVFYHWLQKGSGVFLSRGKVHYRQHSMNLVGLKKLTPERIGLILQTKIEHYDALVSDYPHLRALQADQHAKLKSIQEDSAFLDRMLVALNEKAINYFWWEETEYIHE